MDFLIEYLPACFSEDNDLSDTEVFVNQGYDYSNEQDCPQVTIQLLDNSENEQYSSFSAENVSNFAIQLNVFAENMVIGNEVYKAQRACSFLADKIKGYMNDLKYQRLNENLVRLTRIGLDYTTPYIDESSQIYVSVLRFECQTVYPYSKSLENI